ncbi:oxidoreductase [Salipiger sp. HF18]|nr:oxidoreductase [Salipiger sp. HF18]
MRNLAVLVAFFTQIGLSTSWAADLEAPRGDVLLTISGDITQTNIGDTAEFDYDMIAALPVTVVVTSTPWTDGPTEFTGAALADLLDAVGAQGSVIKAVALNGYIVNIPLVDARETGATIAYLRDGKRMTVRNKGPLWIIYPFDNLTGDQDVYFNRAIWQLRYLEVGED